MSPEDPNNPGLNTKNPDLSSVPLPEPSPIKSPYAPVGGTLGDVADDMSKNDAVTAPQESSTIDTANAIPTAGATADGASAQTDSTTPTAETPTADTAAKKDFKLPKALIIAIPVAIVLIVAIILVIVLVSGSGGDPGSNGKTGSFFNTKSLFIPNNSKREKYAFFDGKNLSDYDYAFATAFVDGYALVKKDGKVGIIDENGNMTVDYDKYDNIVEYGGLYGATKDNKNQLIDGQGRVIREYTNEFNNYGEIESGNRAALTVFREGDKKYTVYSPRGEKLTSFESEDAPTVSSTNLYNTRSTSAVVFNSGLYIYDDSGSEVMHIERNIAKKYLVSDASEDRKTVALSTKPGAIKKKNTTPGNSHSIDYEVSNDGRFNASVVNGEIHEYDNSACTGIVYEKSFSDDGKGFLMCINGLGQGAMFIDSMGVMTNHKVNITTYSSQEQDIFPLDTDDYVIKENENDYGLFVDGKKKTSFKTSRKIENMKDESTGKDVTQNTDVSYNIVNSFANLYVVQKITEVSRNGIKTSGQYEASFYNKKGEKICSLPENKYYITKNGIIKGNRIGFNHRGYGAIELAGATAYSINQLVLINDKCEQISDTKYNSIVGGYDGNYLYASLRGNSSISSTTFRLLDKDGSAVKSFSGVEDVRINLNYFPDSTYGGKYTALEEGNYSAKKELLFYGKKTGVPIYGGSYSGSDIIIGDNYIVIKNGDHDAKTVETSIVNDDGDMIYHKIDKSGNND